MKKSLRALIIEDSEFDAVLLINQLRLGHYQVAWQRVDTASAMRQALAAQPWDIVYSDHQMPEFSAPEALQLLHESGLDLPFLIVSGGIGEATAVALMKAGAHDFLIKGQLGRLLPATERELREAANRAARRQAEQQVRESEMRYRLLWQHSPDAILMIDTAGQIGFVNPAVQTVFGYAPQDLLGKPSRILFAADAGIDLAPGPFAGPDGAESSPLRELTARHQNGQEIIVEIGCRALDLQGQFWWVAFIRDLTARRQAEQALRLKEEEYRLVREIQHRLFPKAPPLLTGYDIAGASFPADEAGGDYFDYLPMLNGGWGIVVGDVAGHGMGPAMIMAETRAYLRIAALNRMLPSDALTRANRVLADDLGESDRFVTVFFARLDPSTRCVTYCNAGHPAAYLLGADGELERRLPRTGRALGMVADTEYQDGDTLTLAPGDLLLVLTDGVEEAVGPDDGLFGAERVLELLRTHRHLPAQAIVKALYTATRTFTQDRRQTDDITAVVVKVLPDSSVDAPLPAP